MHSQLFQKDNPCLTGSEIQGSVDTETFDNPEIQALFLNELKGNAGQVEVLVEFVDEE
jgi:hypothetical protein